MPRAKTGAQLVLDVLLEISTKCNEDIEKTTSSWEALDDQSKLDYGYKRLAYTVLFYNRKDILVKQIIHNFPKDNLERVEDILYLVEEHERSLDELFREHDNSYSEKINIESEIDNILYPPTPPAEYALDDESYGSEIDDGSEYTYDSYSTIDDTENNEEHLPYSIVPLRIKHTICSLEIAIKEINISSIETSIIDKLTREERYKKTRTDQMAEVENLRAYITELREILILSNISESPHPRVKFFVDKALETLREMYLDEFGSFTKLNDLNNKKLVESDPHKKFLLSVHIESCEWLMFGKEIKLEMFILGIQKMLKRADDNNCNVLAGPHNLIEEIALVLRVELLMVDILPLLKRLARAQHLIITFRKTLSKTNVSDAHKSKFTHCLAEAQSNLLLLKLKYHYMSTKAFIDIEGESLLINKIEEFTSLIDDYENYHKEQYADKSQMDFTITEDILQRILVFNKSFENTIFCIELSLSECNITDNLTVYPQLTAC